MAKKQQPKNLEKLCLRKWYLTEYKKLILSAEEGLWGLGLEGGLEHCYKLLEEEIFLVKAFDINSFFVFASYDRGENYELVFDSQNLNTQSV